MRLILTLALSLSSVAAFADQCQWNSPNEANAAKRLISLNKDVMFYCQNCGETKPSFIAEVSEVKVRTPESFNGQLERQYRTVTLVIGREEKEVDLAYTYVRTGSDIFANVAQLVGCDSHGAVTFIQTTNRNQKIQHYYNESGDRKDTATTTAKNGANTNGRVPASARKK